MRPPSSATFEFFGSRDSQVTDAMFCGSASRRTSSSTHMLSETMRRGFPGASVAPRCAIADSSATAVRMRRRQRTVANILLSGRDPRSASVPLSIGNPDPSEDTKTRAVEAGRVLITLVEQVVDATEHGRVLVDGVVGRQIEDGIAGCG